MTYKSIAFILILASTHSAMADSFFKDSRFYGNSAIQFKNDQLRDKVNDSRTNITDLSLVFEQDIDESKILRVEILGEENQRSQQFNLGVGELYYRDKSLLDLFDSTLGFMKLKYGVLNPIDGNFFRLPSYYQFLYNLPRGIDVGGFIETKSVYGVSFGTGAYLGKSTRDIDGYQPKSESLPLHAYIKIQPGLNHQFRIQYFENKFENLPLTNVYGLDYLGSLYYRKFSFSLASELFLLDITEENLDLSGLAYLFSPKIQYDKFYYQAVISTETWESNSTQTEELYLSNRFGYNISKNIIFEIEQLNISSNELEKEKALQARLFLNWSL